MLETDSNTQSFHAFLQSLKVSDRELLLRFSEILDSVSCESFAVDESRPSLYNLLEKSSLVVDDSASRHLTSAIWILYLKKVKDSKSNDLLKYPTIEDFTNEYSGEFPEIDQNELHKLWQNANWMNELFKMIVPKRNKGFALDVVPRVVEGWSVKYVTGGAPSLSTRNRIKLYERESGTAPRRRHTTSAVNILTQLRLDLPLGASNNTDDLKPGKIKHDSISTPTPTDSEQSSPSISKKQRIEGFGNTNVEMTVIPSSSTMITIKVDLHDQDRNCTGTCSFQFDLPLLQAISKYIPLTLSEIEGVKTVD